MAYGVQESKEVGAEEAEGPYSPGGSVELKPVTDSTHRKLKPRHIQLIGIGGYVYLCPGEGRVAGGGR